MVERTAVDDEHPMSQCRYGDDGDVVGDDVTTTTHHRVRLGKPDQRHPAARRRPETYAVVLPGRVEQFDHVPSDRLGHVHPVDRVAAGDDLVERPTGATSGAACGRGVR